jgi:hypothetical protein
MNAGYPLEAMMGAPRAAMRLKFSFNTAASFGGLPERPRGATAASSVDHCSLNRERTANRNPVG